MRNLAAVGAAIVALFGIADPPVAGAQPTEFEVASIKLVKAAARAEPSIKTSATTVTIQSKNLIGLLMWAYEIPEANQISGPDWMLTEDYDITAKAPTPASTGQLRIMLQNLLEQRFRLMLHREQKIVASYSLVVDKTGLKIREVQEEPRNGAKIGMANGVLTLQMVNHISELTAMLPQFLEDRPVADKTGLAGVYDITLKVELDADQMKRMPRQGMVFDGFGYTSGIFDAVQKLGLKLDATKGPVDFLVVDHVERPTEN